MEYPENLNVKLQFSGIMDPTVETILYLLLIIVILLATVILYILKVPILTQLIDFFKPTMVKYFYKIILIIFSLKKDGR